MTKTTGEDTGMTVRFAWYDLWVGVYIDRERRRLYVCPLPCLLLTFQFRAVERTQE